MKKIMKAVSFLLAAPFVLSVGVSAAAGDIERGKVISTQGNGSGALACATCHGPDGKGNSAAGFPDIAGLNADYLSKQLHDYVNGSRKNAIMQPVASALSDADIKAVTTYYQSLETPVAAIPHQTPDSANQGEWLAMRGDWDNDIPACNQCHGPNGMGVGNSFPAIAGQHASYLKAQLLAWRDGSRDNDPNQLMKGIANRLTEQQITAITNYYESMPEQLADQTSVKESHQ